MRSPLIVRASNTFEERLRNLRLRNLREFAAFLQANVAMDDITTAIARKFLLEHLTIEILAYGRQKPAFSHFVARIFKKILAEQLTHFIRYLL